MSRAIFEGDHDLFRETVRSFVAAEVSPNVAKWEAVGRVDKEMFRKAGQAGLLGMAVPEEYGGGGVDDFSNSSEAGVTWRGTRSPGRSGTPVSKPSTEGRPRS